MPISSRSRPRRGLHRIPGIRPLIFAALLIPAATTVRAATPLPASGSRTDAAGHAEWLLTGTAGGGHDDNVLGRPGDQLSDGSLSQKYLELSPDLRAAWSNSRWSVMGAWTWDFEAYESSSAGVVHDHFGQIRGTWVAAPRLTLEAGGEFESYRRPERNDFDYTRFSGSVEGKLRLSGRWLIRSALETGRTSYPNRTIRPLSQIEQEDEPWALAISGEYRPDMRWELRGGLARILNGSNSTQYDFAGWRTTATALVQAGRQWAISTGVTRERRHYDQFLRRSLILGRSAVRVSRDDEATWLNLDVTRLVSRDLSLFAGLIWLDYTSSESGYSYDQIQVRTGFTISFGGSLTPSPATGQEWWPACAVSNPGTPGGKQDRTAAQPEADQAAATEGMILFRCRAPGAGSVSVVGSFNGWRDSASPMSDPDGDGVWETRMHLAPGLYRYMFLVDGREWRSPEGAALYEDDGFGLRNAILEVGGDGHSPEGSR